MTSKRNAANRRNAKRSTGPRSPRGKKTAAKNAIRHGLNISITKDQTKREAVSQLTDKIAGSTSNPLQRSTATHLAETFVEQWRAKSAAQLLYIELDDLLTTLAQPRSAKNTSKNNLSGATEFTGQIKALTALIGQTFEPPSRQMTDVLQDLAKIERYERRVASKLKKAVRSLDANINTT